MLAPGSVSQQKGPDTTAQPHGKFSDMTTIKVNGTAAQSPPPTANRVADFGGAIRDACVALNSGSIEAAINSLEKASRRAGEVGDPRATELANFANALAPALETVQLVAMCLGDLPRE
jgi:hypothetical protein